MQQKPIFKAGVGERAGKAHRFSLHAPLLIIGVFIPIKNTEYPIIGLSLPFFTLLSFFGSPNDRDRIVSHPWNYFDVGGAELMMIAKFPKIVRLGFLPFADNQHPVV
jgi:hypothetical protein